MKTIPLFCLVLSAIGLASCEHGYFLIDQAQSAARDEEVNSRFDRLEKTLGVLVPNKEDASDESVQVAFPLASFPRATCGDILPADKSIYPLSYYPIFIKNTGDNLQIVKDKFCSDAIAKKDKNTGEEVIQVASFYTNKASEFLRLMEQNFGEARLGTESVVVAPF
jgi:hypothetical protein